jgi:hypothetical protein
VPCHDKKNINILYLGLIKALAKPKVPTLPMRAKRVGHYFTILFHMPLLVHIMSYHLAKEDMQMAFGGIDLDDCRSKNRFGEGIAIVVVIILLLIAMGIVF